MSFDNPFLLLNIALQANDPRTARSLVLASKSFAAFSNTDGFETLFARYGSRNWKFHARKGNLKAIQWLHRNQCDERNKPDSEPMTEVIEVATQNGRLAILQWIHDNELPGLWISAMNTAALHNHLDIVRWLHENRTEGCTRWAMTLAASYGHLEVLQWLHENRSEGCVPELAITAAAHKGRVDVVRWLFYNRPECTLRVAIRFAVAHHHTDVLHWLQAHFDTASEASEASEAGFENQE